MNEMIERVARAICRSQKRDPDYVWSDGKPEWTMFESNAIAVIAAMREPTEAMLDAGLANMDWADDPNLEEADASNRRTAGHVFKAMISAALAGRDVG